MPEILDWQRAAQTDAIVCQAAQALASGRIVVFPTECGYVAAASAALPASVLRLSGMDRLSTDACLKLVLAEPEQVVDWVPEISVVGQRLARRCWPGPVELVWSECECGGQAAILGDEVRSRLFARGTLDIRVPDHAAILYSLDVVPDPVVIRVLPTHASEATAAESAHRYFADADVLLIDDGPGRYTQPPTVVRVEGNRWQIVSEGVVSQAIIEQLTGCGILFVCTGNTCRSPLAEALCKKLLAERLKCRPEELPQRGFIVQSAGLSAMMGGTAAAEAVAVAAHHGADLSGHYSQLLTAGRLLQADFVLTMTRSHLFALEQLFPSLGPQPRLLDSAGGDVADPIGGSRDVYDECARQILCHLERFLTEVPLS